MFDKTHGLRVL